VSATNLFFPRLAVKFVFVLGVDPQETFFFHIGFYYSY